jgi:CHAD domain-containing protein
MADGKWIEGLTPEMPVLEAARLTLEVRLGVIEHHLGPAVEPAPKDPEPVHQLRVGTRRAVAALDIFAACLKPKRHRKTRKRLARLRRAAGAARDWDVFQIELADRPVTPPGDFLLGYARGQRDVAQAGLDAAVAEFPDGFQQFRQKVVDRLAAPEKGASSLRELAAPLLHDLIEQLSAAARQDMHDYAHLHSVRILGKRLRYAMEVFGCCYGAAFREEMYPAVEAMQEILGAANDSHVAAGRIKALRQRLRAADSAAWARVRAEVDAWLRHHERRLPVERRKFMTWWKRWQQRDPKAWLTSLAVT